MNGGNNGKTVLVTEGENRATLAVTRSLGRIGCRVIVTGEREKNLASCSRYCAESYAVPAPTHDGAGYLAAMLRILSSQQVDVLLPMTEPAILLLAEHRKQLPATTILACPELDKIQRIFDKCAVFRLAEELGVAMPWTLFIDDREDFQRKKAAVTAFPVVVKPGRSRIPLKDGFLTAGVRYAADQPALEKLYHSEPSLDFPSMIQERIIGPGTGLFTLFDRDCHHALFSHQRLLEKPPSGGVSVVSGSVPLDPEMVEAARRLLAAVGWQGVAMVEFKRDLRDNRAKLMEINGRFWGTLQLAISCGVDFPVLFLRQVTKGEQPKLSIGTYRTDLKLKWFLGTLDHLFIRLRHRDATLHLPPGSGTKMQAIGEFLAFKEKDMVFDVIDKGDLGPFRHELGRYILNLFMRN